MKTKVVIIGASITGINVMSELVKNNFDGEITIIDKKNVFPYNTYPLSKDWIKDMDDIQPPYLKKESYYENNNINLKLNTKIDSIDWKEKTIKTDNSEVIPYDNLVIATGSKLREVSLPGDDAKGVFYLREFKDALAIKEWSKKVEDVVIIGSGFIGLELASTFSQLGKKVSVLVRSGRPLDKILGAEASEYFTKMHQSHGINFMFGEEIKEFVKDQQGNLKSITTKNDNNIKCEMAFVAVGVMPNISFTIDSLNIDRAIIVNEYGETSLPNIYAGGDVAAWPYKGNLIHVEHWEIAWSQGISIARNILKEKSNKYIVTPYFWTDQYDQTFEYLGHAVNWDKTVIRGSLEEKQYAIAYLDKDNLPLGILFANKFENREDIQKLFDRNKAINIVKFSDVKIPIIEN